MSNDIEDRLRNALRPIDPPEGFADRVLARVEAERAKQTGADRASVTPIGTAKQSGRKRAPFVRWLPLAVAACAVLTFTIVHQSRVRQEEAGMEARRQLLEALRVTSDKLDSAYHAVHDDAKAPPTTSSGA